MKKHLLLLFAALLPLVASAQTKVEIDGIWYNLITKGKVAEVTSGGNYSGAITIPATVNYEGTDYSVTSIGESAFENCYNLAAITLSEGVTSIGNRAFVSCSSFTAITLPKGVKSIGEYAFSSCSNLTAITLPKGVKSIENGTFSSCNSLTAITLPEGVTSIGDWAFSGCSSLTTITIPEGVTSIGGCAFENCSNLTTITLSEGVTRITHDAFYNCSSLTNINIPKSVTNIEDCAFQSCQSLTAINIPEGVTSIGRWAFYGCTSLTTIVLSKSLKYIYEQAFANCSELLDVYCYAGSVPRTEADAFDGSYPEYATLHVPASAVNEYKNTAPWSSFGTIKTIENVTLEKYATPTISYVNGKVVLTCETEGAKVITTVTANNDNTFEALEFDYIPTQTFIAYATKENYENSDPVSLTICWVPCTEEHEKDDADGILTIPAKPVLIQCQGGVITVSGLAEGTEVAVYTTSGTLVATVTAEGESTHLTVPTGQVYIVKVADTVVKIGM